MNDMTSSNPGIVEKVKADGGPGDEMKLEPVPVLDQVCTRKAKRWEHWERPLSGSKLIVTDGDGDSERPASYIPKKEKGTYINHYVASVSHAPYKGTTGNRYQSTAL